MWANPELEKRRARERILHSKQRVTASREHLARSRELLAHSAGLLAGGRFAVSAHRNRAT
jgi:hypothetical protein